MDILVATFGFLKLYVKDDSGDYVIEDTRDDKKYSQPVYFDSFQQAVFFLMSIFVTKYPNDDVATLLDLTEEN